MIKILINNNSTRLDKSHITRFKMANSSLDDSAYTSFSFESYNFNTYDEILPSEEEFVEQVKQNCLTSTDEKGFGYKITKNKYRSHK